MTLYHSDDFTKAYPAGGVTLPVGSVLHVGVSVEESETERFVVVLEDCYATQSPDPKDIMRYYIIQNKYVCRCLGLYSRNIWRRFSQTQIKSGPGLTLYMELLHMLFTPGSGLFCLGTEP